MPKNMSDIHVQEKGVDNLSPKVDLAENKDFTVRDVPNISSAHTTNSKIDDTQPEINKKANLGPHKFNWYEGETPSPNDPKAFCLDCKEHLNDHIPDHEVYNSDPTEMEPEDTPVDTRLQREASLPSGLEKKAFDFLRPDNQLQNSEKFQSKDVHQQERNRGHRGRVVDPEHDRRLHHNKQQSGEKDIHDIAREDDEKRKKEKEDREKEQQEKLMALKQRLQHVASKEEKELRYNSNLEVRNFVNSTWFDSTAELEEVRQWLNQKIKAAATIEDKNDYMTALGKVAVILIRGGKLNKKANPADYRGAWRNKADTHSKMDLADSHHEFEPGPNGVDCKHCNLNDLAGKHESPEEAAFEYHNQESVLDQMKGKQANLNKKAGFDYDSGMEAQRQFENTWTPSKEDVDFDNKWQKDYQAAGNKPDALNVDHLMCEDCGGTQPDFTKCKNPGCMNNRNKYAHFDKKANPLSENMSIPSLDPKRVERDNPHAINWKPVKGPVAYPETSWQSQNSGATHGMLWSGNKTDGSKTQDLTEYGYHPQNGWMHMPKD